MRTQHVLPLLLVVAAAGAARAEDPPAPAVSPSAVAAAGAYLSLLTPVQARQGHLAFDHPSRRAWDFQPGRRLGVTRLEMSPPQRAAFGRLLETALSPTGLGLVREVWVLEGILQAGLPEGTRRRSPDWRNPGLYYVTVFGRPGPEARWAWRLEGHHLSLHATYRGEEVTSTTPCFFGANPADVRRGPHAGLSPLRPRSDAVRAFLGALPPGLKRSAQPGASPIGEITMRPGRPAAPPPGGLLASEMAPHVRAQLWEVVGGWFGVWNASIAARCLEEARTSDPARVRLLWRGAIEPGRDHTLVIAGPTFALELDRHGNHVHSVWRDPRGDGR